MPDSPLLPRWPWLLILLLALLLLELETGAWLFPPVLLLVVLGLPGCFFLLVLGPDRWRPLVRRFGLLLGLAALAFPVVSQWQQTVSERRAATLIRALDAYHTDHRAYPDSLAQLVPAYLPQLPQTGYSLLTPTPFVYFPPPLTQDSAAYALGYGQPFFVEATYSSNTGQWRYAD